MGSADCDSVVVLITQDKPIPAALYSQHNAGTAGDMPSGMALTWGGRKGWERSQVTCACIGARS